jgi:hemerythrin-like domain-containing protein
VESPNAPSTWEGLDVPVSLPPQVRLSNRALLDEATRPEAAVRAGGHYTAAQRAAAQHLVDVHDHLRAELDAVRALVERVLDSALTPEAARSHLNVMTMRQHSWSLGAYCQSYCRLVTGHHSLEDVAMLPHLRRVQPDLGPVIDRLEEEHVLIHGVLEEVDRALVRFVGDPAHGARLQDAVDLLTDTLLSHLSYEEHQLVEPLARHGHGLG